MENNTRVVNNKLFNCCLPESENNHPWLVITHGNELQIKTFYSVSRDLYFEKKIPEMHNKQVSQASYGWWLLIDDDDLDCCLMNPKTMEIIQLPQVHKFGSYRCALSKPPTEPNCHILLLGSGSILFCRVGDKKFIQQPREYQGGYMLTVTNFQGQIYAWMTEKRGVVTVDFEKKSLVLKNLVKKDGKQCRIPYRKLALSNSRFQDDHLIESCGELLLVHMICDPLHSEQIASFKIFKFDLVEMDCKELNTIGDRAIFLSSFGSMAMLFSSKESGVENILHQPNGR